MAETSASLPLIKYLSCAVYWRGAEEGNSFSIRASCGTWQAFGAIGGT